jgi:CRISPR/Cas system-associated exonuclease Cas4 (RecB family)
MKKSEEYLKEFELMLRCKYSSSSTIKSYLFCVGKFFEYSAGKKMEPMDLIKNYLVWAVKSKEPKTINLHRSAVVSFFKLVKGIEITTSQVPRKKEKRNCRK